MKVTYIHHSSFLVELEHLALLFDYFEGEIPVIREDKPLFIFASHRHGDHFSPSIFELADRKGKVTYVLSDDIWRRQAPEEIIGRIVFLGPGEEVQLPDGAGGAMDIQTYKSTDEGVAFLVRTEGKTIYHAGDLNNWVWEGEPEQDNIRMSENYHKELAKLAGRHIDVAFVPIDPRQEKDFYLGLDDFMGTVGAETVFPMHFWGDFEAASRLKELRCAAGYRDRIREIHKKGECFTV